MSESSPLSPSSRARTGLALFLAVALCPALMGSSCGDPLEFWDTTPNGGTPEVSVHADLTAAFSRDVDPASVNAGSITVETGAGAPVSGQVSVRNHMLGFVPDAALASNTSYTAVIDGSIADLDGDMLGSDLSWSFSTGPFSSPLTPVPIHQHVDAGVTSVSLLMVVVRSQRHVVTTSDGTMALAVQRGDSPTGPDGLVLYRSTDEGLSWSVVDIVTTGTNAFADVELRDDDGLLIVFTDGQDVKVVGYTYSPGLQAWTRQGDSIVDSFSALLGAERATIVEEPDGGFWCAFMTPYPDRQYAVYHSTTGATWTAMPQRFATANTENKSGKLLVVGNEVWLIFYDVAEPEDRKFQVAVRTIGTPSSTPWTIEPLVEITRPLENDQIDPLNSHWSVARAPNGDVHMAYQDDGIRHIRSDAVAQSWGPSTQILTAGIESIYPSVAISDDGVVAVVFDFDVEKRLVASYSTDRGASWSFPPFDVQGQIYSGRLRAITPERFDERLSVLLPAETGLTDYRLRTAIIQF